MAHQKPKPARAPVEVRRTVTIVPKGTMMRRPKEESNSDGSPPGPSSAPAAPEAAPPLPRRPTIVFPKVVIKRLSSTRPMPIIRPPLLVRPSTDRNQTGPPIDPRKLSVVFPVNRTPILKPPAKVRPGQPPGCVSDMYTGVIPDPPIIHRFVNSNTGTIALERHSVDGEFKRRKSPPINLNLEPPPGIIAVAPCRGSNRGYEFSSACEQPRRLFHPEQPQLIDPQLAAEILQKRMAEAEDLAAVPPSENTKTEIGFDFGLPPNRTTLLDVKTEEPTHIQQPGLDREIKAEPLDDEPMAATNNQVLDEQASREEEQFYDPDEHADEVDMETLSIVKRPSIINNKQIKPAISREGSTDFIEVNESNESEEDEGPSTTQKTKVPPPKPKLPRSIIYLGPQEPMKDREEYRTRRYKITKVKKFDAAHLRPFGRRPPGMADEMRHLGVPGLGTVLIEETDLEAYEWEVDERERKEALEQAETARLDSMEEKRQEEALASKISEEQKKQERERDDFERMYDMPSIDDDDDDFVGERDSQPKTNKFRRIFDSCRPLAHIPIMNEKLSEVNPTLYANLQRIHRMFKGNVFITGAPPLINYETDAPTNTTTEGTSLEKQSGNRRDQPTQMYKVQWNGLVTEVPSKMVCQLCQDVMILYMRKSYYFGHLCEYPAYRCLRKGCQTFRSMKKVIQDANVGTSNGQQGQEHDSQSGGVPSSSASKVPGSHDVGSMLQDNQHKTANNGATESKLNTIQVQNQ